MAASQRASIFGGSLVRSPCPAPRRAVAQEFLHVSQHEDIKERGDRGLNCQLFALV
jgi:hypothetical protein